MYNKNIKYLMSIKRYKRTLILSYCTKVLCINNDILTRHQIVLFNNAKLKLLLKKVNGKDESIPMGKKFETPIS